MNLILFFIFYFSGINMDKSWMFASRMSQEYLDGVDDFLEHCKTISKNIKFKSVVALGVWDFWNSKST